MSHIGFDFNTVEKLILNNNFKILKKYYSPFDYLGFWLNSQIYWLIKKNNYNQRHLATKHAF